MPPVVGDVLECFEEWKTSFHQIENEYVESNYSSY